MPLAQELQRIFKKEQKQIASKRARDERLFSSELRGRIIEETRKGNNWLEVTGLNENDYKGKKLALWEQIMIEPRSLKFLSNNNQKVAQWLLKEGFKVSVRRKPVPRLAIEPENNLDYISIIAEWKL